MDEGEHCHSLLDKMDNNNHNNSSNHNDLINDQLPHNSQWYLQYPQYLHNLYWQHL